MERLLGRATAIAVPVEPDEPSLPMLNTSHLNPAEWMHERLVKRIIEFEADLSPEEEVGARLVATPEPDGLLHVEDVSFWGPDMIIFLGINRHGKNVELIQHYTQVNLLLTAVPKLEDEPRRIGFRLEKALNESEKE